MDLVGEGAVLHAGLAPEERLARRADHLNPPTRVQRVYNLQPSNRSLSLRLRGLLLGKQQQK